MLPIFTCAACVARADGMGVCGRINDSKSHFVKLYMEYNNRGQIATVWKFRGMYHT